MKAYIEKVIDYTLKRKGDKTYRIVVVDDSNRIINEFGRLKRKSVAKRLLKELGIKYAGETVAHKNYEHWKDFKFAR